VLDEERNRTVKGEGKISADGAKSVWVLPADEEIVVARAVAEVLRSGG
jgi:acetate kinase